MKIRVKGNLSRKKDIRRDISLQDKHRHIARYFLALAAHYSLHVYDLGPFCARMACVTTKKFFIR